MSPRAPQTFRTDLALIRACLNHAERTTVRAAAARYGTHASTVIAWRRARSANGPQWPTDADIAAQAQERAEKGAWRARQAAHANRYRLAALAGIPAMTVDGTGTRRRLQALAALGWTLHDLSQRLGWSRTRIGHLTTGVNSRVRIGTVAAVRGVYAELSMRTPNAPERVLAKRRGIAAAKGYAVPLAWDDATIDNPSTRPIGAAWTKKRRAA